MCAFRRSKINLERLIKCLSDTKNHIDNCNCGYSIDGLSDADIAMDLAIAIEALENGEKNDESHLRILFSASGPIHQIAIGEGWEERFRFLSAEFDAAAPSSC